MIIQGVQKQMIPVSNYTVPTNFCWSQILLEMIAKSCVLIFKNSMINKKFKRAIT